MLGFHGIDILGPAATPDPRTLSVLPLLLVTTHLITALVDVLDML